jgi:hypothetical protein
MNADTPHGSKEPLASGTAGRAETNNSSGSGHPTPRQESTATPATPMYCKAMDDELKRAARIFGIDLSAGFKSDRLAGQPPYGNQVREIETKDNQVLMFDLATGELRTFYEWDREKVPEGLMKADAITKEKAQEAAQNLLKELNIDAVFEADRFTYRNGINPQLGKLEGAEWVSTASLRYTGVPYFGSGVHVVISAYSGRVVAYSYRPAGPPPVSMEENIDANQAAAVATAFWTNRFPNMPPFKIVGEPVRAITLPNNFWNRSKGQPLTAAAAFRLCWLVNVSFSDNEFPSRVYVDAQTGEACGGM